jgi:hypothetical protein
VGRLGELWWCGGSCGALHLRERRRILRAIVPMHCPPPAPPFSQKKGWTGLHVACNDGHVPMVELLLDRGANKEAVLVGDVCPCVLFSLDPVSLVLCSRAVKLLAPKHLGQIAPSHPPASPCYPPSAPPPCLDDGAVL